MGTQLSVNQEASSQQTLALPPYTGVHSPSAALETREHDMRTGGAEVMSVPPAVEVGAVKTTLLLVYWHSRV